MRAAIAAALSLSFALSTAACFKGDGAHETAPDPRRERSRVREVARWEGTYRFEECPGASTSPEPGKAACSRYRVTVTKEGDAWVSVDHEAKTTRMLARPRVENETLKLTFREYEEDLKGLHGLDPLRGKLTTGDPIATLTRSLSGKVCIQFEKLEARQGAKSLCMPEPEPT